MPLIPMSLALGVLVVGSCFHIFALERAIFPNKQLAYQVLILFFVFVSLINVNLSVASCRTSVAGIAPRQERRIFMFSQGFLQYRNR